jgi:hypothetical protein
VQPLLDIRLGAPANPTAVIVQTAGTQGDPAKASLIFTFANTQQKLRQGVDAAGGATLPVPAGQLPVGVYTATVELDPANPYYVSTTRRPPVAVVVNTDVLGAIVYALSDLLKSIPSL